MRPVHVDPEEAVRIHQDVGSRRSLAMHWGTFRLTLEPLDEPPQRLAAALDAANIAREQFVVLQHGQTLDCSPD
jgi:N-acyl-phosphatidylethanolamine-hydrolysing phospholipase D